MPIVEEELYINAAIETCFDAARDIGLHTQTVWGHTFEKAVDGVLKGPIGLGDTVTFRATHFGIRQQLTSKITEYDRPNLFIDEMLQGAFRYMKHIHRFEKHGEGTVMRDILDFQSPCGLAGKLFDRLILERYMKRFLQHRNRKLKEWLERTTSAVE